MSRTPASRFYLAREASEDLAAIRTYLDDIPVRFSAPIRRALRSMLHEIVANPQRGATHSEATRYLGQEVKTRVVPPYRLFYRELRGTPEVLAILHTAQDVSALLRERLQ